MKRMLAAIVCCMMILSCLTGCDDVTKEEVAEVVGGIVEDYVGDKLEEVKDAALGTIRDTVGGFQKKQSLPSFEKYVEQETGIQWKNLQSAETKKRCMQEYLQAAWPDGEEVRQKAMKSLLNTVTGDDSVYRMTYDAKKDNVVLDVLNGIHGYTGQVGTMFVPQLCELAGKQKMSDSLKLYSSVGTILTCTNLAFNCFEVLTTDPSQVSPGEAIDKLVNIVTAVISFDSGLMWQNDMSMKQAAKYSKELLVRIDEYNDRIVVTDGILMEDLYECFDVRSDGSVWDAFTSWDRIRAGQGPTAVQTAQTIQKILDSPCYCPELKPNQKRLMERLNSYLEWRLVYEVNVAMGGSPVMERADHLDGLCDRLVAYNNFWSGVRDFLFGY